ncbi:hypothetical protein OCF67_20350 [Bacillus wiedmannii]|uniref:hypothetical protein n=1 Tax=Bacillus wiedmannii TaxID=1890302 RepID=UPI0020D226CD|nr:hypothetical protein [Bacillus wiedmannii]MCU5706523.1 hypothetical protein [Bacillus wiedmannii]
MIYCGKCKRAISFINKSNGKSHVNACSIAEHFGNRCYTMAVSAEVIYAQLFFDVAQYEHQLLNHESKEAKIDSSILQLAVHNKYEELKIYSLMK